MDRVLVVAPHTDDGEFGAGATIAGYIARGVEVYYVAFATGTADYSECYAATAVLGIDRDRVAIYDFKTRELSFRRQMILDRLIALKHEVKPTIALVPSVRDTHQDHCTVAEECIRAFKDISVLAYEIPWNDWDFKPQYYVTFPDFELSRKIEAIEQYRSQDGRYYSSPEFIKSLAVVRGTQVKAKYAEAFEVIRWID